ncbi:hypothetical protein CC80DRAFT_137336 [Byssothecium circinans]|uniref:Uncharacterized protein n=1 Tax=Byssothecium circinans TaxID=147558 RepID=A0A6A5TXN4_9PLEO|nr:hypothetical protein CC80DRAFT_137336 [Byssothecium circinans]
MRSFQQAVLFLFALCAAVFAAEPSFDSTVYVTSTIYRVNTVTASGTPPAIPAANSTSTIAPSYPTATGAPSYSVPNNATSAKPTGTGIVSPSPSAFPGAASSMSANGAFIAVLAAGLGLLAL